MQKTIIAAIITIMIICSFANAQPFYVSTIPTGDELGGDESNFMSLADAADTVSAGEKVWVRADASYTVQDGANDCILHLTTAGTTVTPIVWEGYYTTIGDGGIVTIDAADTLANAGLSGIGGSAFNVLKNFRFTQATADGFAGGTDDDFVFKNCSFDNNGTNGINADNSCRFVNCIAYTNGDDGFDFDATGLAVGCISHSNTAAGFLAQTAVFYNCLEYNNGSFGFQIAGASASALLGCTLDGENAAGDDGFRQNAATGGEDMVMVNCIIYDYDEGAVADGAYTENIVSRFNLFNSNNTDVNANWLSVDAGSGVADRGDVSSSQTAGQLFTDEPNDDYTPASASDALATGLDAGWSASFWASFLGATNPPTAPSVGYLDIGAIQREAAAGSGGGQPVIGGGVVR